MSARSAEHYRKIYEDISGELTLAAADGDATLVTVRNASYTIFIQRIVFAVTTDAIQSCTFEGTGGTPIIFGIVTSPGIGVREVNFGAEGVPLDEGDNFLLDVSAAGLAGQIAWEGYQRLTAIISASSGGSNQ